MSAASEVSDFSLPLLTTDVASLSLVIEIGDMPVRIHTGNVDFLQMLQDRYAGFVSNAERAEIEIEVELIRPETSDPNADVEVTYCKNLWSLRSPTLYWGTCETIPFP